MKSLGAVAACECDHFPGEVVQDEVLCSCVGYVSKPS